MQAKSRTLLVVFLLTLLLVLAGWYAGLFASARTRPGSGSGQPEQETPGTPSELDAGAAAATDPGAPNADMERERQHDGSQVPSRLTLVVCTPDGSPVSSIVSWSTYADPSVSARSMPMFAGTEKDGVFQSICERELTIEVPQGEWTWLKCVRKDSPTRAWYFRVAPFEGREVKELVLDGATRALHVFVWNADMNGPAADREVNIYAADLQSGRQPSIVKTIKTDEHGYAVARGLPPGRFFVAGPGSGLRDRHPHCAQLILPVQMPVAEATCVVVATPEKIAVEVRVFANLAGPRDTPLRAKLFLKRLDDGSGTPYPIDGGIAPGKNMFSVMVPPGTYEPGVLPIGSLTLERPERFLQVEEGRKNTLIIAARRNPPSTRLELKGIKAKHLPITVHPRRRSDVVVVEDDRLFFLGDYRWRSQAHRVPPLPYRCQLVVSGRGATFLSEKDVSITGAEVIVPVVPASRIQLRWFGPDSVACPEAVITATTGSDVLLTRMHRDLVRVGANLVPAFVAFVVVPLGHVTLECRRADGSVAWTRAHDSAGAPATIDVGEG